MSDLTDVLREMADRNAVASPTELRIAAKALDSAHRRIDALEAAIREAAAELRAIHYTVGIGCVECYPKTGRWPCDADLVARDLTKALEP